jgi:hypothetical protein
MIHPTDAQLDNFGLLAVVPGHFIERSRSLRHQHPDPWSRRSLTGADIKRNSFLEHLDEANEEISSKRDSFRGLFKRVKSIVPRRQKNY